MTRTKVLIPTGVIAAALILAAVFAGGVVKQASSADHLDAPLLTSPRGDGRLDLNDIYLFQSPSDADKTALIMTVNPAAGVLSPDTFKPGGANGYEWRIDNNGNAVDDRIIRVNFSKPDASGEQRYRLRMFDAGGNNIMVNARGVTGQRVDFDGGSVQAGQFDDPFFFDLNGFLNNDFCTGEPGDDVRDDFFAGLDVSAIVLEIPSDWITDGDPNISVWARTKLNGEQADRTAIPALNTVFIPDEKKNAYNEGRPVGDRNRFGQFFGDLADVLLPDRLPFDTTNTSGFLNGRQLADDVIDAELSLITDGAVTTDCVDANDVAFQTAFPYLAPPHGSGTNGS